MRRDTRDAYACPFEDDILDAVRTGRWPERATGELQAHVAACRCCAELLEVAGALIDARDHASLPPGMPGSDVVWYRAKLRARQEAARAASRPIALAQGIALGCAAGLLVALCGFAWPWAESWVHALAARLPSIDVGAIEPSVVQGLMPRQLVGILALVVLLVLASATLAIVLSDES